MFTDLNRSGATMMYTVLKVFYIHDPQLQNFILHTSNLNAALGYRITKVDDTAYLHKERHGEWCGTSIQVGVEFLGYIVNHLRAPCHGARFWRITAQLLQVKDLSKYYRRDLIGMSKSELLSTKQDVLVRTTSETKG